MDSGRSAKFEKVMKELQRRSCDRVAHAEADLLTHLVGVHDLLESWGETEEVCLAGLAHSLYGTEHFQRASIGFLEREDLVELLGERAERLVFLFCEMNRGQWLSEIRSGLDKRIVSRRTGEELEASEEDTRALLAISLANDLDQRSRLPRTFPWLHRRDYLRVRDLISPAGLRSYFDETRLDLNGEKNILVIGAKSPQGARAVDELLSLGYHLYATDGSDVLNRWGGEVSSAAPLSEDAGPSEWHAVVDFQTCEAAAADALCRKLSARCRRYLWVFEESSLAAEELRRVGAIFSSAMTGRFCFARLPVVLSSDLGENWRLQRAIWRVLTGQKFNASSATLLPTVVSSAQAGRFAAWLMETKILGDAACAPLHHCTYGDFIRWIEESIGRPVPKVLTEKADGTHKAAPSLHGVEGFQFEPMENWLPALVEKASRALDSGLIETPDFVRY
jgi:hypothetical protein